MTLSFVDIFVIYLATMGGLKATVVFGHLAAGESAEFRNKIAARTVITSSIVLGLFAVLGGQILHVMHISLPALVLAGGVVLLKFALDLMFGEGLGPAGAVKKGGSLDMAIYPLAVPLMATPQAIVAVVAISAAAQSHSDRIVSYVCIAVIMGLNFLMMRFSDVILRRMSSAIMHLTAKVLAILLAGLAMQMLILGFTRLGLIDRATWQV